MHRLLGVVDIMAIQSLQSKPVIKDLIQKVAVGGNLLMTYSRDRLLYLVLPEISGMEFGSLEKTS